MSHSSSRTSPLSTRENGTLARRFRQTVSNSQSNQPRLTPTSSSTRKPQPDDVTRSTTMGPAIRAWPTRLGVEFSLARRCSTHAGNPGQRRSAHSTGRAAIKQRYYKIGWSLSRRRIPTRTSCRHPQDTRYRRHGDWARAELHRVPTVRGTLSALIALKPSSRTTRASSRARLALLNLVTNDGLVRPLGRRPATRELAVRAQLENGVP